jgi:hypothetical protein
MIHIQQSSSSNRIEKLVRLAHKEWTRKAPFQHHDKEISARHRQAYLLLGQDIPTLLLALRRLKPLDCCIQDRFSSRQLQIHGRTKLLM